MDLYFDILDDLSDELGLSEYFHFLGINELTIELQYKVIRRAEHYIACRYRSGSDILFREGDLVTLKWLCQNNQQINMNDSFKLFLAGKHGHLEMFKYIFERRTYRLSMGAEHDIENNSTDEIVKWFREAMKIDKKPATHLENV